MINKFILKAWENQGLSKEDIIKRAESLGYVLPIEYYSDNGMSDVIGIKKERTKKIKNDIIRAFRPSAEVDNILLQIKKGHISKFVNKAILFYYKEVKEKKNNGN
ncbi:hypothetical protein COU58_04210 [Candidatus Pacearchaeota archaeon CG10_big_fil_rev_8_21_14_0_10_32_42]|nr:MAG: hypothetical protein COU58_04210 [Candidatus Pacearchaeota archaeon CG10_big_fil_rev_8_21_14_0_10_32_42]